MCISSYAQTDTLSRKQRTKEWFYKVEAYLKQSALSQVDTNYLGLPEHGWGVSLNTNLGQSFMHTTGKNFDILGDPDMRLHSALNARLGGSIGYQTLRISFSYDLNKGYSSQLRFNIMQNAWGIEVHWHNNSSLHGTISSPLIETTNVKKGTFSLTTLHLPPIMCSTTAVSPYRLLLPSHIYSNALQVPLCCMPSLPPQKPLSTIRAY